MGLTQKLIKNVKKATREGAPKDTTKEKLTFISYVHKTTHNMKVPSRFGVNVSFFFAPNRL